MALSLNTLRAFGLSEEKVYSFLEGLHLISTPSKERCGLRLEVIREAFCKQYNLNPHTTQHSELLIDLLSKALHHKFGSNARAKYDGKIFWRLEFDADQVDSNLYFAAPFKKVKINPQVSVVVEYNESAMDIGIPPNEHLSDNFEVQSVVQESNYTTVCESEVSDSVVSKPPFQSVTSHLQRSPLPPLGTSEMHHFALEQMQSAPANIQKLLRHVPIKLYDVGGVDVSSNPVFVTHKHRQELNTRGFTIIPSVLSDDMVNELQHYIELKAKSERMDRNAYEHLCKCRGNTGLVLKHGWTKYDYAGPLQQIVTAIPSVYRCASEALRFSRIIANLYEYKHCHSREELSAKIREFLHIDVNLIMMMLLEEAAQMSMSNIFYQMIAVLSDMTPDGATISFAQGFHNVWKSAIYQSIQTRGYWQRAWTTSSLEDVLLPEDHQRLIMDQLEPITAKRGSVIIFNSMLPHAPNLNSSGSTRYAAYPFYAPLITFQNEASPMTAESFLPNGFQDIQRSVLYHTPPTLSAHPWCHYPLSKLSHKFYPTLPPYQVPRSLLADCLYGFQPWAQFESSITGKEILGPSSRKNMANLELESLQVMKGVNTWLYGHVRQHQHHQRLYSAGCVACIRLRSCSLEEWWHSSTAVWHRLRGCECYRCYEVALWNWRHWTDKKACNGIISISKSDPLLLWLKSNLGFSVAKHDQLLAVAKLEGGQIVNFFSVDCTYSRSVRASRCSACDHLRTQLCDLYLCYYLSTSLDRTHKEVCCRLTISIT